LIATPSCRLPQKWFTKKAHWIEVILCLLTLLTGIVIFIVCAFSARLGSSLLQILRNSSFHHSVLMLLSLSSVTNFCLLFGFWEACRLSYRCLQMERWAAVTVIAILLKPALLMWPYASIARPSALSPWASYAILHSRHHANSILPIFELTGCWRHLKSCHSHPQACPSPQFVCFRFNPNTFPASTLLHPVSVSSIGIE